MSIENLNTAVRAAGFAMATSDEPADDTKPDKLLQSDAWRPGEAMLLSQDETRSESRAKHRRSAEGRARTAGAQRAGLTRQACELPGTYRGDSASVPVGSRVNRSGSARARSVAATHSSTSP